MKYMNFVIIFIMCCTMCCIMYYIKEKHIGTIINHTIKTKKIPDLHWCNYEIISYRVPYCDEVEHGRCINVVIKNVIDKSNDYGIICTKYGYKNETIRNMTVLIDNKEIYIVDICYNCVNRQIDNYVILFNNAYYILPINLLTIILISVFLQI